MRKFIFLCAFCASVLTAFAQEDTRTVITECNFTGWNPAFIVVGQTGYDAVDNILYSLKPEEGAVYYLPGLMVSLMRWDEEQYDYTPLYDEQITPGYYYLDCQLRIDNENGSLYRFPDDKEDLTVLVNGWNWDVYQTPRIEPNYSFVWIGSPVYPIGGVPVLKENGNLPGKFSVSSTKQVRFASGNLQRRWYYDDWSFAEHQWDVIGADNTNISNPDYEGYIDLFGWGTSGYNDKFPQTATTVSSDYGPATGDIAGTPYDWGSVTESMDLDTTWRTLTADEWDYLLNTRDNAANLRSIATVNGQKGLVVLPDNWNFSQTALELEPDFYGDIIIDARKWECWWEMAGAIFLPCTGYRTGTTVKNVSTEANYWTSTRYESDATTAYHLYVPSSGGDAQVGHSKIYYGMAVRLVQDDVYKPEPLIGKFSIAADKQIQFSKGNLQYHCKNQTWQFAKNQWDTIGGANTNIAADYDGFIDLFGWGTGNNPTLTSVTTEDYSTFTDWGTKIGEPDEWRTLTDEETEYLLYTRSKTLFGMGKVNNVKGLIILPDDWTDPKPNDVSFEPSTAHGLNDEGYGAYSNNGGTDNFIWNDYTKEDWEAMEAAGAVFLPAAGYRKSPEAGAPTTEVVDVNVMGVYWTSIPTGNQAYALWFSKIVLKSRWYFARGYGFPVRLVHDYTPGSATAIDTPSSREIQGAVKFFRNGQLLIEKNGKIYTVQGVEIK